MNTKAVKQSGPKKISANAKAVRPSRHTKVPAAATKVTKSARTPSGSKQSQLIHLMQRPDGATLAQLTDATGWQPHSVRGVISGILRKKLGLSVTLDNRPNGERAYRVSA